MKANVLDDFFKRYYNEVRLYAYSLCKDLTQAEEYASEAFYRCLKVDNVQELTVKFWLLRVCRNLWIDDMRRKKRKVKLDENRPSETYDLAERIIEKEEYASLYRAISLLSEEYREVITLFYFEKLKIKEIAALTEKTEDNVKVLLFRARNKIKNLMEA